MCFPKDAIPGERQGTTGRIEYGKNASPVPGAISHACFSKRQVRRGHLRSQGARERTRGTEVLLRVAASTRRLRQLRKCGEVSEYGEVEASGSMNAQSFFRSLSGQLGGSLRRTSRTVQRICDWSQCDMTT